MKEDLTRIDEGWTAARFDSLPHVVHILTSKDREGEIQFLKEQSDIVEEVVDEVVHAYHSGFNKAIQNYSQVCQYLHLLLILDGNSCPCFVATLVLFGLSWTLPVDVQYFYLSNFQVHILIFFGYFLSSSCSDSFFWVRGSICSCLTNFHAF